jgi:expansin (peptidoglycan-binding protein)
MLAASPSRSRLSNTVVAGVAAGLAAGIVAGIALLAACGSSGSSSGDDDDDDDVVVDGDGGAPDPLGEEHQGEFHLGPVEWNGAIWNACAPYPEEIQAIEGTFLAGVSGELAGDGGYCDACIQVTTDLGRSIVARVVTYGQTTAPGNIDVSPAAFAALDEGQYPRSMVWRLVECPGTDPIYLQFQTGAHVDWTSFWVRNPRIAVDHVEVTSARHPTFTTLRRGPDGTFNDDGGFGAGPFTVRVVGIDGASVDLSFDSFVGGDLLAGDTNL